MSKTLLLFLSFLFGISTAFAEDTEFSIAKEMGAALDNPAVVFHYDGVGVGACADMITERIYSESACRSTLDPTDKEQIIKKISRDFVSGKDKCPVTLIRELTKVLSTKKVKKASNTVKTSFKGYSPVIDLSYLSMGGIGDVDEVRAIWKADAIVSIKGVEEYLDPVYRGSSGYFEPVTLGTGYLMISGAGYNGDVIRLTDLKDGKCGEDQLSRIPDVMKEMGASIAKVQKDKKSEEKN